MDDPRDPGPAPDPRALRAFAHPLRWKLADLLYSESAATATRCAQVLDESEASCSYHLRILAKYGWIEPAPQQRRSREKPWRLARGQQDLFPVGADHAGTIAAEAATDVFLDHELTRIKERLRRRKLEPGPWQQAARMRGVTTWLTVGELREVSDQIDEILVRYVDRGQDRSLRPAGAREVRLFAATSVAPPP